MDKPKTVGAADLAQSEMFPRAVSFMATSFFVPASTIRGDLSGDAECLEAAARGIVEMATYGLSVDGNLADNPNIASRALWGALHLLEIADGLRALAMRAPEKGGVS